MNSNKPYSRVERINKQILDENPQKICLVVDKSRLLGTITDGDIRRGLLRGIPFTDAAQKVMNSSPYTVSDDTNRVKVREFMTSKQLLYMPTVDENGKLTGIITLTDLVPIDKPHNNWVILMAGGLGERLRPLTKNTPKPLIKIGNKPLLQSILENFIEQKFDQFYISVNYQADAIKKQFGDGSSWGVNIKYLEETYASEDIVVNTELLLAEGKKLKLAHQMNRVSDGALLATCDQFLLHVSLETRSSCVPLSPVADAIRILAQ